jgi:hypothetical protein
MGAILARMGRRAVAWMVWVMVVLPGCYRVHGLGRDPDPLDGSRADGGRLDGSRGPEPARDAGRDARDVGRVDVGLDAGRDSVCRVARPHTICDSVCAPDAPYLYYWSALGCVPMDCNGGCFGPCDPPTATLAECEEAHRGCAAQLCRDTGGEWLYAEECGHRVCGRSVGDDCPLTISVCDCGPLSVFDERLGCVLSPSCEPDTRRGEALCVGTGGTWGPTCCHARCGEPCADDCASLACTCGPTQLFDETRGCMDAEACLYRGLGERCTAPGQGCAPPYFCCETCEGGCTGDYRCMPNSCAAGRCRTE